jgi:hypothetical protein
VLTSVPPRVAWTTVQRSLMVSSVVDSRILTLKLAQPPWRLANEQGFGGDYPVGHVEASPPDQSMINATVSRGCD